MTIGIYSLYWEEQDLIYIGQSQNIEGRFKEHTNDLSKNKHSNYKVQDAYHKYGLPELIILEKCELSQLNDLEIVWQKEFNSLDSLDLIEAGQVGYGTNSNASKYSKLQILLIFRSLYLTAIPYQEIADKYTAKKSLVADIGRGKTHLWLKEKYPKQYMKIGTNRLIRKALNKPTIGRILGSKQIQSPDGIIFTIDNLTEFCNNHPEFIESSIHNFYVGIGRVLDKSRKTYKGWRQISPSNISL